MIINGSLSDSIDLLGFDRVLRRGTGRVIERGSILLGYHRERLIGFIGEHLEGSMGLLYVFPEFRRQGFGTALEKICISVTLRKSFIPFIYVFLCFICYSALY